MSADGCQPPLAAGHSPALGRSSSSGVSDWGLAGRGADPVCCLPGHGHPGGKPSRPPFDAARAAPGSPSPSRATSSGTRSPPTCWRTATTSAPSMSCWPPGRQHHDDLHPRPQLGPRGGAKLGRPSVRVRDLARPDYPAPGTHQISSGGARYITALGLGGVLQGRGNMGVHRLSRIDAP